MELFKRWRWLSTGPRARISEQRPQLPRRRSCSYQPRVEVLEDRTLLDTTGPRITGYTPTEVRNAPFDHLDVTFNEPIEVTTFNPADVTLNGPAGPVLVSSTNLVSGNTFRIGFPALTARGSYQATIGPNIDDLSANQMDQNQNGVNGEATADQFIAPFIYINANANFTNSTLISETNTTYEGMDLLIDGSTVTIDGPHSFNSIHLVHGAILTHTANTATQTHKLDVTVTEQVIVDATSRIDVTGRGYAAGRTTGNTTVGGATGLAGGSHAGLGGLGFSNGGGGSTNSVHDHYASPTDWGSASGSLAGGGALHLSAGMLQLDGTIRADGATLVGVGGGGAGGGAGGSILLNLQTLTGTGSIRSAGGDGWNSGNAINPFSGGGGGGGRVAVLAQNLTGFDTSKVTATGGRRAPDGISRDGGAGTVYLRDTDDAQGTLLLDAGTGGDGQTPLGLPGQASFTIPDAVVVRGTRTHVQSEHPGLMLDFRHTLEVSGAGSLQVAGDLHLTPPLALMVTSSGQLDVTGNLTADVPLTVTGGASLQVAGALTTGQPLMVKGSAVINVAGTFTAPVLLTITTGGVLTVNGPLDLAAAPTLTSGGLLQVSGAVTAVFPLTVNGGMLSADQVVVPELSLVGGGVLTHPASTASAMHGLSIQVAGLLLIDATSGIDVTGKGYTAGRTAGNTTVGGAAGLAGGSHGGLGGLGSSNGGGGSTSSVHDDYANPTDWGSGSGSLAGGGRISLAAGTLQLDGAIRADGETRVGVGGGGAGGGAGGSILVNVQTLTGTGSVRAAGGDGWNSGNAINPFSGGGGGGGRVAVLAQNLTGFDMSKVTATGGRRAPDGISRDGGAGTVYLRDTDDAQGTLLLDAGTGGDGQTPLGLPGQASFIIPDAVVIRGSRTHVQSEHPGIVLNFRYSLEVSGTGSLQVTGDLRLAPPLALILTSSGRLDVSGNLTADVPLTVTDGARLQVSGALTTALPLTVTGSAVVNVGGTFAAPVPLTITTSGVLSVNGPLALAAPPTLTSGGLLQVSGAVTAAFPVTVDGGILFADQVVMAALALVGGGVLTHPPSSPGAMHWLNIQVTGLLRVDATSRIDVTGQGYARTRTTGDTTVGAATGSSGGSYGGLGHLGIQVYGDYAFPDDWGSGGGGGAGGGRVSVQAQTLELHGQLVADGQKLPIPFGGGGSGGGILVDVDGLQGGGLIRAGGGPGKASPFANGGGGGGGRVAVYARNVTGFNTGQITAPGGIGDPGWSPAPGSAGTVHIAAGKPHTHVRWHSPAGINGGHVSAPITSIQLHFNKPINLATFDPSDILLDGQMGHVQATGMTVVGDRLYRVDLEVPLTENGPYHFTLFPTLFDAEGFALDQDADGQPGEPEDFYTVTLIVDRTSPRATNHVPAGDIAGTIDHVDVWFSERIDRTTFTTSDVVITRPNGQTVGASGIQEVGLNRFRITFAAQTLVGLYHVQIGPDVRDLAGNLLDQNRDGTAGEPGQDVYDASFNVVQVDLGLNSLNVSPGQLWAGEPMTVSWSGANRSGAPLLGNWRDAAYLSTDNAWDFNDALLATVPHTGGLTLGEAYAASITVLVPGILPGNYYVLVRADIENQEREINEADNVVASGAIPVGVRPLGNGATAHGTITTTERGDYYAIAAAGAESFGVVLDGLAASGANELYASFEAIPTRLSYDARSVKDQTFLDRQDQMLALTAPPGGGTFYVLVYGDEINGTTPYDLTATTGSFVVTTITPNRGTNRPQDVNATNRPSVGRVIPTVVTVNGAGFNGATVVEFIGSDAIVRTPRTTRFVSSSTLSLDLDVTPWPADTYDVRVHKGTATYTRAAVFTVVQGGVARLETHIVAPAVVSFFASPAQTLWIEYRNSGDAPMPAPLLSLTGNQGAFITADASLASAFRTPTSYPVAVTNTVQVIAMGSGSTPGILQPGDSGRIPVYYLGRAIHGNLIITFTLSNLTADEVSWQRTDSSTVVNTLPDGRREIITTTTTTGEDWHVDWSTSASRPESVPADAWNAVVANLQSQIGTEWGHYVEAMAGSLNFLATLGQSTRDVGQVWNFEVAQASASLNPVRYLAGSVDAAVPTPGLPLSFSRTYGQPIISRYELGPLGRGWSHNWDIRAEMQSGGDVVVRGPGGVDRFFTLDRGNYVGAPGDHGQLILSGGAYRLVETDQTSWRFRTDGLLDYVAEPNDIRIALSYSTGRLTAVTHSNGQQLLLAYNAAGRIVSVTATLGPGAADDRVTTYGYDATGEYLVSVTSPDIRVTSYTYDTGTVLPRKHALTQVTYPDNTHSFFSYDVYGRLAETSADGGAERVQYAYDTAGGVIVTDATNRTTTLAYGLSGRLEQVRDGDGRVVDFTNCACGQVTQIVGPAGEKYAYTYDAFGNLATLTDPLRQVTTFTYDASFNQLTSVKDARGNGMQYGYDARGNLTSITYADGSRETYTYDAAGNVLTATNRRNQTIAYTYNAAGQVLTRDYLTTAGFVDYVYTYDPAGNLASARDINGTTTLGYWPNTDLLRRIDYPGGRFFTFDYDAAGRRTRRTDQDGNVENYSYDPAGRLDTMTDGPGALIVDYDYDAAGRLSRKTLGNGVYTLYDYDAAGNVEHLVNYRADGSVLSRFDYTYDLSGRRTSMTTLQGTFTYGYDPLGQLTSVTHPDGHVVTYAYDAAGNRTVVTDNGVPTAYTTNNLNQYTTVGGVGYTFDADGNMTSKTENGVTTIYTYDIENRLIGVSTPTDAWTYTYDPFGNRVGATHNGVATTYVIDPTGLGNVAAEYDGSGQLIARYDHGYGLVSRADAGANPAYYTFSAIGNTSELTDAGGVVLNSYTFEPFGSPIVEIETVLNPFTYIGEYAVFEDEVAGHLMASRFYEPRLGRFLQEDQIGIAGGLNILAYAHNDPANWNDPDGRQPRRDNFEVIIGPAPITIPELEDRPEDPWEVFNRIRREELLRRARRDVNGWRRLRDQLREIDEYRYRTVPCDAISGALEFANCTARLYQRLERRAEIVEWHGNINWFSIRTVTSSDPNDKLAPTGNGPVAFVQANNVLSYQIRFENKSDATAPARLIVITDRLDDDLDLNTFELTEIAFANQTFTVPPGLNHYETTVPLTANGVAILVEVQAALDRATRTITLTLRAIDPATGWFPEDPLIGLLYPNDDTGRGTGSVSYRVAPKPGLPSGTRIENRARIVFDYNDPIDTPLVFNTLDAGTPTSAVLPLPAETEADTFTVQWAGQDEANGSGIASYDVYVSVDGGPFVLLLGDTTTTSVSVTGQAGHTYAFYSIARDNVGHVEDAPATPDTVLFILFPLLLEAGPNRSAEEGELVGLPGAAYTFGGAQAVLQVAINWGDGSNEAGTLVPATGGGTLANTHRFPDNGSYVVTITLNDDRGRTRIDSFTLTVGNVAPTATLSNNGPLVPPGPATVSFTNQLDPSTADTAAGFRYSYDFNNDGDFTDAGDLLDVASASASFDFPATGAYTVRGRIKDKDDGFTDYTSVVTVAAVPTVLSVVVNDGSAQRSLVTSLTITFSTLVDLDPGAIRVVQLGSGGGDVTLSLTITENSSLTQVAITFVSGPGGIVGGSLADGNYQLIIDGSKVRERVLGLALDGDGDGTAGGDRVDAFFRLLGDSDGDRMVDDQDFIRFRSTFRKKAGDAAFLSWFDFDGDGDVDALDSFEMSRRRNKTLAP